MALQPPVAVSSGVAAAKGSRTLAMGGKGSAQRLNFLASIYTCISISPVSPIFYRKSFITNPSTVCNYTCYEFARCVQPLAAVRTVSVTPGAWQVSLSSSLFLFSHVFASPGPDTIKT